MNGNVKGGAIIRRAMRWTLAPRDIFARTPRQICRGWGRRENDGGILPKHRLGEMSPIQYVYEMCLATDCVFGNGVPTTGCI